MILVIAKPGRTLNPSPSKARPGFPLPSPIRYQTFLRRTLWTE
jgi:hypothetical protein